MEGCGEGTQRHSWNRYYSWNQETHRFKKDQGREEPDEPLRSPCAPVGGAAREQGELQGNHQEESNWEGILPLVQMGKLQLEKGAGPGVFLFLSDHSGWWRKNISEEKLKGWMVLML